MLRKRIRFDTRISQILGRWREVRGGKEGKRDGVGGREGGCRRGE